MFNDDGTPYVPSSLETALRTAGFRSSQEAVLATKRWEETREAGRFKETHDNILEAIRANALDPDEKREQKINDDIAEYNNILIEKGKAGKIPFITERSIETQLRNLGLYGTDPEEVTQFKENLKQVKFAEENYRVLYEKDKPAAQKFDIKNKRFRELGYSFKIAERQLAKYRARKKEIVESGVYSPEKQQAYLDLIDKQMVKIAELQNKYFERATIGK